MSRTTIFRHILITGASGGLGAALAKAYAEPGVVLALAGRDRARLTEVADRCRQRGAEVLASQVDVTDAQAVMDWVRATDRAYPLELVIANAGVASTLAAGQGGESWQDIRRVFDTNVYGTLATLSPAIEAMTARGRGQVALMSSLGAYVGMPISPAYNASKAALKVYGEGLRGLLAERGVGVTVICPGFVKSAMSDAYPGPRPFLVAADDAAARIRAGLAGNRALIAFPFPLALAMRLLAALPTWASLALQRMFHFG